MCNSEYIRILILSLLASLILVPLVRFLALKFDILDHPKSRKIHAHPMPKLGGLAIYLAFMIGVLSSCNYNNSQLKGVLLGSSLVFLVGLIDDIRHLRASLRLLIQIVAAYIVISHGVVLKIFPYYALNAIFTVVGIVGITNALNFLDNMDGLAAGLTCICVFGIFAISYHSGQRWLVFLSISLFGSTLGFLRYNFKPAKIFMGDSGSTFLGFTIASMSIMASWSEYTIIAITVPVLILGLMIFDTTMISVLRILEGKVRTFRQWLEHADKDHISHRLVEMGMQQREAVMFLYICNLILVSVAIVLPKDGVKSAVFTLVSYIVVSVWSIKKLHEIKMKHLTLKGDPL